MHFSRAGASAGLGWAWLSHDNWVGKGDSGQPAPAARPYVNMALGINKIPIYPILYLLKGDYKRFGGCLKAQASGFQSLKLQGGRTRSYPLFCKLATRDNRVV